MTKYLLNKQGYETNEFYGFESDKDPATLQAELDQCVEIFRREDEIRDKENQGKKEEDKVYVWGFNFYGVNVHDFIHDWYKILTLEEFWQQSVEAGKQDL